MRLLLWSILVFFVSDVQRFHCWALKELSRGISFHWRTSSLHATGDKNHKNTAAPLLYSILTASSPSLFVRTWGCTGRSHQGKPSASRCLWWCRGWMSAWNGRRTYREPKSSSPDGCQMSYSGCWCSGRTDARPSSSDGGTESWWSPVGEKERYINSVEDQLKYMWLEKSANCLLSLMLRYDYILFNCLNINNIELFSCWRNRIQPQIFGCTEQSIIRKWKINQDFTEPAVRPNWVIWDKGS